MKKNIDVYLKKNDALNDNKVDFFFETITFISTKTITYIKSRFEFSTNIEIESTFQSSTEIIDLLYHNDKLIDFRRLCIFSFCIEDIMKIVHNNDYFEFVKCLETVF